MPSRDDPDSGSSVRLTEFRHGPESCRKTFGWKPETGIGSAKVRLMEVSSERPEEECAIRWKFCYLLLSGLSSGDTEKQKCRDLRVEIVEEIVSTAKPFLRSSGQAHPCSKTFHRGDEIRDGEGGQETVEDLKNSICFEFHEWEDSKR